MSICDDLEDDYDNAGASEEDLEEDFWEVTHGAMKGGECENPEPFVTLIWSETLRKFVNEPPPLPDSDGPAVGARFLHSYIHQARPRRCGLRRQRSTGLLT